MLQNQTKRLTLHRSYFPHGVFGTLCDEFGNKLCYTIERPWQDNAKGKSCVPEGEYHLTPHQSPKFGQCYALDGEEHGVTIFGPSQRTHILIHKANKASQLQGCIAPGMTFGVLDGEWAVLSSTQAFNKLMKHLNGENALLDIRRAEI
ncbi:DUF5675 family protein [Vibrio mediterranei]|uniref:DUF5675 family protein n=1 Tax=Vibrio mediterranei TaxID=689 RepID=UPI001EFCF2DC|nr:DUF5675 family protein [Vibrio mediterranei]MCG9624621.1 DUF5675 family protein [Vibrio mediterranei]